MELNKKTKLFIYGLGLAVFIAILSVAGVEMTSQPGFCKTCHSMEVTAYKTWHQSTHKNIDCLECHRDEGIVGLVKVKLGGLRQVYLTVTGNTPNKIVAEVPNERCIKCHKDIPDTKNIKESKYQELREKKKIKYDHAQHLKEVKNCTECHSRVVHQESKSTVSDFKAKCLDCHAKRNVENGQKCATCHESYHKDNYNILHSQDVVKGTQKCTECHAKSDWKQGIVGVGPNYCQECHKVEVPHKPIFVKNHGQEFEKNQDSCKQCHNSESVKIGSKAKTCIACHKVDMPHAKGFKDTHANEFKKNPAACISCHNPANEKAGSKAQACATCHSKADVHPSTWKSVHGKESKKADATCSTCHSSNSNLGFKAVSCKDCHSKLDIHKSNWRSKHYSASKKADATCKNCHSSQGKALGFKALTCSQCHKKGHKSGFIKVHESKYKQNVINCSTCHKKGGIAQQCISCHKVSMPHPSTWNKTHGATAKVNSSVCVKCHSSKNPVNPKASYAKPGFCTTCHAQGGGHPDNWVSVHNVEALKTNGNACATCHSVRPGGNGQAGWCYTCHKTQYQHPDGWSSPFDHGAAYLEKGDNACNLCHVKENDCLQCHGPKW